MEEKEKYRHDTAVPLDTLYHYTSQRGLLGIIREECIWATDVRYLSDSTEFSYAIDLASQLLKESVPDDESDLSEMISLVRSSETGPVFAASFSSKPDQLSQWRGYCPDNGGFMLGFDIREIKRLVKEQRFQLVDCVYDTGEQRTILNKKIPLSEDFSFYRSMISRISSGRNPIWFWSNSKHADLKSLAIQRNASPLSILKSSAVGWPSVASCQWIPPSRCSPRARTNPCRKHCTPRRWQYC